MAAMIRETTYRRQIFFYFLLFALVAVWARVLYAVYEHTVNEDLLLYENTSLLKDELYMDANVSISRPSYIADFLDPFEPPKSLFKKTKPTVEKAAVPKKEVIVSEIPVLRLKGVTGVTATVDGGDDVIHFVRPGDSIGEVKILKVTKDQVLARFNNSKFTLKIKP